jgi:divinyl protochlorophyllide a 8-vinyl-reductase
MSATTQGPTLSRPRKGFLGPQAVTQILDAVEKLCGSAARKTLLREAQLHRVPDWDEPVREEKVARLHQTLRRLFPDRATAVARAAGRATTDYILDTRVSAHGQRLLSMTRKPVAVWMLTRAARQHAWAFQGSGKFRVNPPLEYEVIGNPVCKGEHADSPVCHYHVAAFERLYQRLVDPRMTCREVACVATGAPSCRFVIGMPD